MRFRLVLCGIVCVDVILYVWYMLSMYVCDSVCGRSEILISALLLDFLFLILSYIDILSCIGFLSC